MAMTAAYRLFYGGLAAPTGVAVILASGIIGITWRHYRRRPLIDISLWDLYLFGIVIHVVMLAWMLLLPWETALRVLSSITLPVLLIYPAATALLGMLMIKRLQRQRMEGLVHDSEKLLNDSQEMARLGGWTYDVAQKRVTWTDEVYRIYGVDKNYDPSDIEKAISFYAEDDQPVIQKAFTNVMRLNEPYDLEMQFRAADGTRKWVRSIGKPVLKDGKIIKVVGNIMDITVRKSMERSLKDSETRYRLLFEQSPDGIVIIDPDTARPLDFNETAHRQLGYSRDEFATLSISDLEALETSEDIRTRIANVMREGRNDFDTKHRTRQGEIRNIHVTAQLTEIQGQAVYHCIWRDITDRKLAEDRLRESEAFLNTLLNTIPIPVFYKDETGTYLGFNEAFETFFGMTEEYLVGKSVFDINPPELAQVYQRKDKEIFASKETQQYEAQVRNSEGSLRDVVFNKAVFTDSRGAVGGLVGTILDITERKSTEEQLREREEMMRHIIQHDPNAIAVYDRNLHYIAVSNRYLQDYEIKETDILGKHHYEVFPEMPQKWKDVHQRCLAGAIERNDDDYFERPDGSITYNRWECRPWYDASGQIGGIVTYTEVTTERKKAEKALRESEEQFRKMFEESPLGKVMVNSDFRFIRANAAFCRTLGYTEQELLSLTLKDVTHPDHVEGDILRGNELISGKISLYRTEKRYIRKDKTIMWGSAVVNIVRGEDNRFLYLLATIEDITSRKQTEEEKERLEKQLQHALKMESVGLLAGGVAHDYNNMLGVILGYTELALTKTDSEQPLYADLQEIKKAARRSADITRQLLAFARKQTIVPEILDLNETVEGMLRMLQRLIGEQVDLVWLPGTDLWTVKVDPSQLDQILANLCVNARDAITDIGKITIKTRNTVFDEAYCSQHLGFVPGEFVRLTVSDDGNGMDKDTLEKAFEPFFTTKDVGKGTGLGLSTVYGIIKQNNGFINTYSEPDKGTTFKIYLPRGDNKTDKHWKNNTAVIDFGHGETILVVEDEISNLRLCKLMLEELRYKVMTAATPGEAIRVAGEHADEIQMVITDVIMPEMNGRDLVDQLHSRYPKLKYLFMSGHPADVIARHGVLEEGMAFIEKPFSMGALAAKAREVLDRE
jgi:PAS domain S-box-containing protein